MVINSHTCCLAAIDAFLLRSKSVPSVSGRSRVSNRSAASSQRKLEDAQQGVVSSALNLKQIEEEFLIREKEDEAVKQRLLDQEKRRLDHEAEVEKLNRERKKREAFQELERKKLQADMIQRSIDDERDGDFTPLPSLGQVDVLPPVAEEVDEFGH